MKIRRSITPINKHIFQVYPMRFLIMLFFLWLPLMDANAGDFEVTPIFCYTAGGSFEDSTNQNDLDLDEGESTGLILSWKDKSREGAFYELFYMHQKTSFEGDMVTFSGAHEIELDIDYLHLGGTYGSEDGRIQPFVSGGLGITHMDFQRGSSEFRFSLSLGAGLKVPITDHIKFRVEGRGFGTVFNSSSEINCSKGQCTVRAKGDMFYQFSVLAGVSICF